MKKDTAQQASIAGAWVHARQGSLKDPFQMNCLRVRLLASGGKILLSHAH